MRLWTACEPWSASWRNRRPALQTHLARVVARRQAWVWTAASAARDAAPATPGAELARPAWVAASVAAAAVTVAPRDAPAGRRGARAMAAEPALLREPWSRASVLREPRERQRPARQALPKEPPTHLARDARHRRAHLRLRRALRSSSRSGRRRRRHGCCCSYRGISLPPKIIPDPRQRPRIGPS